MVLIGFVVESRPYILKLIFHSIGNSNMETLVFLVNLLNPTGFLYVLTGLNLKKKILHGDYFAFMCFVWFPEQTKLTSYKYLIDLFL
jgi:hypothetical protein